MSQVLIFSHDITKYPPILSVINTLVELEQDVVVLGYYSDSKGRVSIEEKGVVYKECIINNVSDSKISKIYNLKSYQKRVKQELLKIDKIDQVWFFGNENVWLFANDIAKYNSIIYFFEVPVFKIPLRYKIFSPFGNYKKAVQSAKTIVCCEYNRAHITKAYFGLKSLPIVIPNKPNFDISESSVGTSPLFVNKKIILYQGIFDYPERRLNELCEAIKYLPQEYLICVMGPNGEHKSRLVKMYESERVHFLPFLAAPDHLSITKQAYIGFLSYFAIQGNVENVLNTMYCAPNKIYEYSKFDIPMIANDVPALNFLFDRFHAGKSVNNFTPKAIAQAILEIDKDYEAFSCGAKALFSSVDIKEIVSTKLLP